MAAKDAGALSRGSLQEKGPGVLSTTPPPRESLRKPKMCALGVFAPRVFSFYSGNMNCLVTKKVNGISVTEFNPTPQMRLFALSAFCDPALSGKEPEFICASIGLSKSAWRRFMEFEPHFSEWLEDMRLTLGGKSKKRLLEMVGMERALAGEFNFWKPLAVREGVINPDQLNVGLNIPANLGALKDMNDEQLAGLENSVMAALRSETQPGEIAMVEGPGGWEPESNPGGAAEMQGSVPPTDELDPNREHSLRELEHF